MVLVGSGSVTFDKDPDQYSGSCHFFLRIRIQDPQIRIHGSGSATLLSWFSELWIYILNIAPFYLHFILYLHLWIPDPYSEYGSGTRKLLNTDPDPESSWIRIRIQKAPEYGSNTDLDPQVHNTGLVLTSQFYLSFCPFFIFCLPLLTSTVEQSAWDSTGRGRKETRGGRILIIGMDILVVFA